MRVVFLGGGTGGHFFPLIAVAEALRTIAEEEKILNITIVLMGDEPFDAELIRSEGLLFEHVPAGKWRRYFSLLNISDMVKTIHGILRACWKFTRRPPDIIFSKGGYDSFPVLVAARLYRIPVIVHESDSVPGKVNLWASRFAARVAFSFPESAQYFSPDTTALTGHPIRRAVLGGSADEAMDFFNLEKNIPVILILGGSQGAQRINETILSALPELVEQVQIIHSAGETQGDTIAAEAALMLEQSPYAHRYHVMPFFSATQLRDAAFVADLIISRAGAGSIFEIAAWQVPAILIPLPHAAQNHQRENAYTYARTGAAEVLEETNLTPHLLTAQILRLLKDENRKEIMKRAAIAFSRIDAAEKIAREIIRLGLHD